MKGALIILCLFLIFIVLPIFLIVLLVKTRRKRKAREALGLDTKNVGDVQFAGFWCRFGAAIIDGIILSIAFLALEFLFMGSIINMSFNPTAAIILQCVGFAVYIAYFAGSLITRWQATPGKRAMRIYVAQADNYNRISFGQALIRYVVLFAPNFLIIIVFLIASPSLIPNPSATMPQVDQQRFTQLMQKQMHHEQLTEEEKKAMNEEMQALQKSNVEMLAQQAHLSDADQQRFLAIQQKQGQKLPLTEEEKSFQKETIERAIGSMSKYGILWVLSFGYMVIIVLMIGLTKQKTGLHDLAAKTRVLRGVPS